MDDDADVLRFRPRGGLDGWGPHDGPGSGSEMSGYDGRGGDEWGLGGDDDGYGGGGSLGHLTKLVIIGQQLVDVVREPVQGSGYECAALELEGRGLLGRPPAPAPPSPPVPPPHERQLAWLSRIVGGDEALASLGTDPLGEEELRLDGVPQTLHGRLLGIDARLQRWAPVLLGDEGLTASRRLLGRAVASEPGLLTRSDRDDIAAGAVLWAVAKGNDLVGNGRPLRAGVIQDVCGLRSSPSYRGGSFAHAVGGDGSTDYGRPIWMFEAQPAVIPLGSPDLLLRRFRQRVVLLRDLALQLRARTPPTEVAGR